MDQIACESTKSFTAQTQNGKIEINEHAKQDKQLHWVSPSN